MLECSWILSAGEICHNNKILTCMHFFHQSILQVVSSFPLPLLEKPACRYDKDDMLTGLHQCTLAENRRYPITYLTKSIMSAKTSSLYSGFEPGITKEIIDVRKASPGETKNRKRVSSIELF